MNKNFTKLTSIFVLTIFIMSALSCNVMASFSYGSAWSDSTPWTGDNRPFAFAVSSAGTALTSTYTCDSTKHSVIESHQGVYGKESTDEIYKTYDLASKTKIERYDAGFICHSNRVTSFGEQYKDMVLTFSFAYDKAGVETNLAAGNDGLLVHSYARIYNTYECTGKNYNEIDNPIAIRTDGIRFSADGVYDFDDVKNAGFLPYNFETGKWYTVDFVFDFENKTSSAVDNLQTEYSWSVYVNGDKIGENKTTTAFYQFVNGFLRWMPAYGAEMYWDNINIYTTDASTFESPNTGANLTSTDDKIVLSDGNIKLDKIATVGDVKAAVEESLAENEEIRAYNSDYSSVITDDVSAIGTKLVVVGSGTLGGETTARETVYTYYDVNADGYFFEEPSIAINGTTGTGKVTLYNYSGELQEFNVYLAVYKGSELVALNASSELAAEAEDTKVEYTTSAVDLLSGDKVKLFVWNKATLAPELEATEESYTIAGEYNPACADLKSITLPTGTYNSKYNEVPSLYPAFNKDVTEYDVYTYVSTGEVNLETANANASVAPTTSPDATLNETTAVYTVTSADGTVTKDYTINYHKLNMAENVFTITGILNAMDTTTGTKNMYSDRRGGSDPASIREYSGIVIQDGVYGGSRNTITRPTRPIIEIDIENGPDTIKHGVLTLSNVRVFGTNEWEKASGTLNVYRIKDDIYSVDGGFTAIADADINNYFDAKLCTVGVGPKSATHGDIYFINIDASYYNSLKAAGKTKMYIGLTGEVSDETTSLAIAFGAGGTGEGNSRFHYIAK